MNKINNLLSWEKIKKIFNGSDLYKQKDFKYFCEYCEVYINEINALYEYLKERIDVEYIPGKENVDKFDLAHLFILYISILIEIIGNFFSCINQTYKFKINVNLFRKRDSKWVMSKDKLNDLNIFREIRKLIMHPLGYKNETNVKKLKIIHHKDKTKKIDMENFKYNSPMPFWKIQPNVYENKNETIILLIPVISATKPPKIIDVFYEQGVACGIVDSPSYIMFLDKIEDFLVEYINQCNNAFRRS